MAEKENNQLKSKTESTDVLSSSNQYDEEIKSIFKLLKGKTYSSAKKTLKNCLYELKSLSKVI